MGDDIAVTNSHFRRNMADAEFDAVVRNHRARADLSNRDLVIGDHAIGIVADSE